MLSLLPAPALARPLAAANDISNTFDSTECVSYAYDYLPRVMKQLIKWTQGTPFDGHPKPLSWVAWFAGQWPAAANGCSADPFPKWNCARPAAN